MTKIFLTVHRSVVDDGFRSLVLKTNTFLTFWCKYIEVYAPLLLLQLSASRRSMTVSLRKGHLGRKNDSASHSSNEARIRTFGGLSRSEKNIMIPILVTIGINMRKEHLVPVLMA